MSEPTSSLRALADAVAHGRVSATALATEALTRIERHDATLNSVVALDAESAVAQAAAVDDQVRAGHPVGPLTGIPVLIKDLEDAAGFATTQASVPLSTKPLCTHDGLVTANLRAAGAIVIGKTNLPEFAIEGYTDNLLFGETHNPWNLAYSPGGSSGGSGAALAAGLVPIATATDGGGSIRIPASMCGLVGLKPTHRLIGRDVPPDWIDFSTYGPLATNVADLRVLLDVWASRVNADPDQTPGGIGTYDVPVKRIVAAHRTSDLGPLPAEVAALFDRAVSDFADLLQIPVEWREPSDFFTDGDPDLDWFTIATAEHVAALGREWVTAHLDEFHFSTAEFMRMGMAVTIDEYLAARRRRFSYVRQLEDLLAPDAVLLTPTVAAAGWLADGRLSDTADPGLLPPEVFSTAVQNVTGHPAISVPAGHFANGLPFGVQLTGPRFADALLLNLAEQWEQAHPWPLVAPGYTPFDLDHLS